MLVFSCFSPPVFLQKILVPPSQPTPPMRHGPSEWAQAALILPTFSTAPHLTLMHQPLTGMEGEKPRKSRERQRRGGVVGGRGLGRGAAVPSISHSSRAPYSRSVIFSRFHLAAPAICHLALAQKRSSEPRSVLFHPPHHPPPLLPSPPSPLPSLSLSSSALSGSGRQRSISRMCTYMRSLVETKACNPLCLICDGSRGFFFPPFWGGKSGGGGNICFCSFFRLIAISFLIHVSVVRNVDLSANGS